ncbi:Type I-B CRISPR-associated protein Cas7/Cst2/DevR [Nitrospira tepida]|uniref:Type I-B CRISPR-associated protein Cas7/Cst2/DevR n=1 Tax=Nitrospira tepida TaxID=2973512 RepID=A0AA86MY19_9BACT|nr:type I-B CRISPR-associated protein Cas7/Cst2/DevR [Nitrospira tepida]CAI4031126.1 Type I-B CRISPR-associated protein Cas7/Cst2/DevR [Nitrospira tepida]
MAFVTGMMLIDAPASALNNAGKDETARVENAMAVKFIRTPTGPIPYVSAQAVRYWLRETLSKNDAAWAMAPTYKENENLAYPASNPIEYWDDDLFGYMRAPDSKSKDRRQKDPNYQKLTPLEEKKGKEVSITRISPFRVGTLVSLGPVKLVEDWGTMARHDGDPVLYQHQFYRATLQGLFSLNLTTAGTFFNGGRVGYRNLDENRIQIARERHLQEATVYGQPAFRLSHQDRAKRVASLIRAIGEMEGGAKLTLHYTDVTPSLIFAAVTRSGNHPFYRIVCANSNGQPAISLDALKEILKVYKDQLLSDVFVGWAKGYLDDHRQAVELLSDAERSSIKFRWGHPREAMIALAEELKQSNNKKWYD